MTRWRNAQALARRLSRAEGFSLTEVLVASVLMLVVLAAAYGIWYGLQRTYSFTDEDLRAQTEARTAMNEMVELIRTAREPDFTLPDSLDLVIVRAGPNELVVWTDVDRDPAHDLELVRFRVDTEGRALYRDTSQDGDSTFATGSAVRLVGSWVSNENTEAGGLFRYVGMNGAALAMAQEPGTGALIVPDPTQIREVHVLLMVDVIIGKSPEHHELSSVVQPRNLRTY